MKINCNAYKDEGSDVKESRDRSFVYKGHGEWSLDVESLHLSFPTYSKNVLIPSATRKKNNDHKLTNHLTLYILKYKRKLEVLFN